jgi:hypothetical protein
LAVSSLVFALLANPCLAASLVPTDVIAGMREEYQDVGYCLRLIGLPILSLIWAATALVVTRARRQRGAAISFMAIALSLCWIAVGSLLTFAPLVPNPDAR